MLIQKKRLLEASGWSGSQPLQRIVIDHVREKKKGRGDLNAENPSLEISASFIKITETKISCMLWEEDIKNFVCHGKNKY